MIENEFIDNQAFFEGGAIKYLQKRPIIFKSNIFRNNTSKYGENIASYPVRIRSQQNFSNNILMINRLNISSVLFEFIDIDNQISHNSQSYFI